MTTDNLLVLLLVGLVAGFLASHVTGGGLGLIGDIVVGILGAFLGTFLASHLGIVVTGLAGLILTAFFGAVILLIVLRALMGGMRGGRYGRRRGVF